jgi:hypothetical protein
VPDQRSGAKTNDLAKQLAAAFQSVVLDEPGTDCGTRETVTVVLTQRNSREYALRWVQDGGRLIVLDGETMPRYVGKAVKMRSPMLCLSQKICSKCAGDLYYRLGIKNVGLLSSRIGSRVLNMSLKKFHNTTVKYLRLNIEKYLDRV